MQTIPDLVTQVARQYGQRPALGIRRGLRTEHWTYEEVEQGMRAVAARLHDALGVAPDDRIMVLSPNSPELVLSMLGAWAAGAILVPVDVRTPLDVMLRIAEQTAPKLMISDLPGAVPGLATVRPGELVSGESPTPQPPPPCAGEGEGESCLPSPAYVGGGWGVGDSPPGLAEIIFTSGTTGVPKGVMLTHANILANVASAKEALPIAVGERLFSLLPLSHMMEQTAGLLAPLAAGATVYYATSRRSSAILAAFQRHQIVMLVCVPEVLTLLMAGIEREVERAGRRRAWDALNAAAERLPMVARPALFRAVHQKLGGHFRMALCGGAPVGQDIQGAWERLGVRVIQGYGATECSPIIAANRYDARIPNSVGWAVPNVEIRLAADGEVQVRGPNVTPGYWREPAATAASFEDGWYRTGDLGEWVATGATVAATAGGALDAGGASPAPTGLVASGLAPPAPPLRLRGRKKEMIVLADGRNVFPEDVEPVLRADPAVKECTVLGRPRGSGVEVHAVVIPADLSNGAASAESRVEAAVRRANGKLGPHQQIGGWSIWDGPDFPRTPSLKVKRAEVLAALAEHRTSASTSVAPAMAGDTLQARVTALLARATGRPAEKIQPESDLHLDLGLDSLGRVELAVLLEEEIGLSLSDAQVAELKTVGDLMAALEQPASTTPPAPLAGWPRSWPVRSLRALFQDAIIFPWLRLWARPLTVEGRERLTDLRGPALLIANHASHFDSSTVLSALPEARRRRTAVAAAADYFFADPRLAFVSSLLLGAFPFHRTGPVAASLAHCGDLADSGHSLLVFPEGTRSTTGQIAPFKPGIGLLARELGLPVVPIYIDGLFQILPKGRTFPRPGPVRVVVGEPLRVDPARSNVEAAAHLEAALRSLARSNG